MTCRRGHSSSRTNKPFMPSSVIGATIHAGDRFRRPQDRLVEDLQHERDGGRDQRAPAEGGHEQRHRLGLVAVQPEEGRDHRPDRERGEHDADRERVRARSEISTSAITAAPRSMASVTSTVNTVFPRRGRRSRSGGTVAGGTQARAGALAPNRSNRPRPLPGGVGAGAAGGAGRAGPPAQARRPACPRSPAKPNEARARAPAEQTAVVEWMGEPVPRPRCARGVRGVHARGLGRP